MTTTDISFVKDDYEVFAVMPKVAADMNWEGNVTCYAHIGQHSCASLNYIREKCVGASPDEYASLKQELERIGYEVYVISIDRIYDVDYTEQRRKQTEF